MPSGRMVVPLALVAILSSTLFHYPFSGGPPAQGQTTATNASKTSTPSGSPDGPQSDRDDQLDALDVLAESLAVDVTTEGLRKSAKRAVRLLLRDSESTPVEREAAVSYLRTFFNLPIRSQAPRLPETRAAVKALTDLYPVTPASEPTVASRPFPPQSVVDEVERFLSAYFDQDALRLEHPKDEAKLLAEDFERLDKSSLKLAVLEEETRAQGADVRFLVATLPDPIDSYTGWQFDPMLDAIAQAIAASDYVLDRFHFPDSDLENSSRPSTAIRLRRVHEGEPGVVLFRKHVGRDTAGVGRLLLLVVHENPSAGVHARALENAVRLIVDWGNPERVVRILGPTFSGSSDSLRRALLLARREVPVPDDYQIRIVTGSATDPSNKPTLERGMPGLVFRATVNPDDVLFRKLDEHIERLGWSSPMAVLFEANTQYGREMIERLNADMTKLKPSDTIQLPFPMNISRLRGTVQPDKTGTPDPLGLPSRFRPLSIEESGNPADQLPQFSPRTTSAYVELVLSRTLQTIRQEHVGTVALMATDSRDKLFLAQQMARYAPDVSIITAESDSLYLHPDYSSYLQGALAVSTYPLFNGNQRWSYGFEGPSARREFASGSAQGIYNAALVLLNYDVERGTSLSRQGHSGSDEPPPTLVEYGRPDQPCAEGCRPPVWISVVGRNGAWPIKAYAVDDGNSYVFTVKPTNANSMRSLATFPSPLFRALLVLMTSGIVACWGFTVLLSRHRRPPHALVHDFDVKGRGYLLASVASVFLIETFIATLSLKRFLIEPSISSGVVFAAVAVCLVALVDLARRALGQILEHSAGDWRRWADPKRISTWTGWALATTGAWGAASLFWYEWRHFVEPPSDALSFLARAVNLGSGASPTLPVVFLGSALALWGLIELARCRRPRVALADAAVHPLVQETINGDLEELKGPWALFNRSILSVPPGLLAIALLTAVATALFSFDPVVAPLVTIEGPWFGRFVAAAVLILQVMVALSLLQFVWLWSGLKQLLLRMAHHQLADAYDRVPRRLSPIGLLPRVPELMELETVVAHWQRSVGAARSTPAGTAAIPAECLDLLQVFQDEMRSAPTTAWSASRTWRTLMNAASHAASELQAGLESGFARDRRVPETAPLGPGPEGRYGLLSATGPAPIDPPESLPGVNEQEEVVAMSMAFIIRDAIARLGHNLVFVTGGVLLVFCSHTLFPFQAHQRLDALAWIYIGVTFAAILTVLVQMKRNEIIARLTSATPGERTTWDGEFVLKLVVFGLLPLLTLFATQFPDLGGMLLHWLEPVQKALP